MGIGDDCASLACAPGEQLHVSTDTLVAGVHFFEDDDPEQIGWKALVCNLSDLAACGASPLAFTLCISLPKFDPDWLSGFSKGLLNAATTFNCPLVGGDTTGSGKNTAIVVSITIFGRSPAGHGGFHRGNAKSGDQLWVSGLPGLARLGLLLAYQARGNLHVLVQDQQLAGHQALLSALPSHLRQRALSALHMPQPRLDLGMKLRGVANAALDLSDGLAGDVAHLAKASGLAIEIDSAALTRLWLQAWPELNAVPVKNEFIELLREISCAGGDDFELCWTSPLDSMQTLKNALGLDGGTPIGRVKPGQGVWLHNDEGSSVALRSNSFDHFSEFNS